ncbi:MAG: VOC family protein [Tepidiformaceae bacterium]
MSEEPTFSVILWTTDVPGLAAFLEKVTGAVVAALHPGYASLRAGTSEIMLHADESYRGHPWYDALMREGAARGIGAEMRFRVPDVEAGYSTALRAGAQAIAPPYDSGGVIECQVMGPDGFLLSLWQPLAI